jgi:surface protein
MNLPFSGISSLSVNWGNGFSSFGTTAPSYTYPSVTPAYYSISISGYATSFGAVGYTGSALISSVSQWGTIGVTSLQGAFRGATNLLSVPSSISEYVTNMSSMFNNASKFNQDISTWNTSRITNMSNMFRDAILFNQNISVWNVSSVTNANFIFCNCPMSTLSNAGNRPVFNIPGYISSCF